MTLALQSGACARYQPRHKVTESLQPAFIGPACHGGAKSSAVVYPENPQVRSRTCACCSQKIPKRMLLFVLTAIVLIKFEWPKKWMTLCLFILWIIPLFGFLHLHTRWGRSVVSWFKKPNWHPLMSAFTSFEDHGDRWIYTIQKARETDPSYQMGPQQMRH